MLFSRRLIDRVKWQAVRCLVLLTAMAGCDDVPRVAVAQEAIPQRVTQVDLAARVAEAVRPVDRATLEQRAEAVRRGEALIASPGDDLKSLINDPRNPTHIYLMPGEYPSRWNPRDSVWIERDGVTVEPANPSRPFPVIPGLAIRASGVTVRGLRIAASVETPNSNGVFVFSGCERVTLENCLVGSFDPPPAPRPMHNVYLQHSDEGRRTSDTNTVRGCLLVGAWQDQLTARGGGTIANNLLLDFEIGIEAKYHATITGNVLLGGREADPERWDRHIGLLIDRPLDAVIERNWVSDLGEADQRQPVYVALNAAVPESDPRPSDGVWTARVTDTRGHDAGRIVGLPDDPHLTGTADEIVTVDANGLNYAAVRKVAMTLETPAELEALIRVCRELAGLE